MLLRSLSALTAVICLLPSIASGRTVAYVSMLRESRIAILEFSPDSGQLTPIGELRTPGEPAALAIGPRGRTLFISIRSHGRLATASIDPRTGLLHLRSVVPAAEDPAFLLPTPDGRQLLTAYYVGASVSVHQVMPDGLLTSADAQWLPTAEKAHGLAFTPSGKFVLTPHTGPNAIYQFRFRDGRLAPADPPLVKTPPQSGPRHVWVHPSQPVVYAVNEQGSSVTRFAWRPRQGGLAAQQTISTIPAEFTGNNACADLEMTRDGRFLYASNRGHHSIAVFAVDPRGALRCVAIEPTEPTPRQFSLTPDNRWLISAGQSSGKLAVFRVDGKTGRLQRRGVHAIGQTPWWITTLDLPTSQPSDPAR